MIGDKNDGGTQRRVRQVTQRLTTSGHIDGIRRRSGTIDETTGSNGRGTGRKSGCRCQGLWGEATRPIPLLACSQTAHHHQTQQVANGRNKDPPSYSQTTAMIRCTIAVLLLAAVANAIPVDNGVEGDPEIECGPTSITVNFNTQKAFEGKVYVKGLFDQAGCRNDEGGRQVAGISLPFDSCNVARTRSLNPKGVFVSTVVIISFHPK
uniref:ZP domain-containing protein n=1 Tax=Plectus sambesii TaxID=2011161 RepID=A0A914UPQ2_9BILA